MRKTVVHSGVVRSGIVVMILATGCSVARPFDEAVLKPGEREDLKLLRIEPVAQRGENDCGPAALSEVLAYWGAPAEMAYSEEPSTVGGLRDEARGRGCRAFLLEGTWEDVLEQIGKGRPLIAAIKPEWRVGLARLSSPEISHLVVLVGVNAAREFVVFDDPEKGRRRLKRKDFERQWAKVKRVGLVIGKEVRSQ